MASPRSDESFASLFENSAGARRGAQRKFVVGEQVEVTIVAVGREGIFAELGGKQEGMFERPELSDADGKLHVDVGSKVSAVVRGVDAGTGQVRLSPVVIRSSSVEPEAGVARKESVASAGSPGSLLVEGSRVKGKVTGIERYGIFVQIAGSSGRGARGLVPTQETGTPRGADLKKHFSVGQDVDTKILNIDETGRIRLSIAALSADDERGMYEAYKSGTPQPAGADAGAGAAKPAPKGKPEPKNFGTLADLLPKIAPKAPSSLAKPAASGAQKPIRRDVPKR